jgi:arylsulfatase A-like enzyme/cytochrome c-type biogenesis protein CcmH/NrfG
MKAKYVILRCIVFSAFLIMLLLVAGGCARQKRDYPNLLLITVDTTRADRLSCYGYKKAITPYLQGLADAGVVFDNAQSCVPITLPSHATILTGLKPPEHSVRVNGETALPESIPTLAEVLKANGYATGAVIASSVMEHSFGLNRGFDFYEDKLDKKDSVPRDQLKTIEDRQHAPYRHGGTQARISCEWIEKQVNSADKKPWFLWSHFYDPHAPYNPHDRLFGAHFKERPYDAEISFMDMMIGKILETLAKYEQKENTLVVVVGDHGEGLGDKGELSHCYFIYKATQHVPLIMAWKGKIQPGLRAGAAVSLADLMPTILDLLAVEQKVYKPKKDIRNRQIEDAGKRSFASAVHGETIADRPCYMETLWPYYAEGWAPLFGLIDENKKIIRAPTPELYDLKVDPHENNNIYDIKKRVADDMSVRLEEVESAMKLIQSTEKVSLSSDQLAKLQSLGYTSGGNHSTESVGGVNLNELIDTKDIKDAITLMSRTADLMRHRPNDPQILTNCLRLVEASPKTAKFHTWLARAYSEADADEAVVLAAYRKALEMAPDDVEVLNNYGMYLGKKERYSEALQYFEKAHSLRKTAVEIKENLVITLSNFAMHSGSAKKFDESERLFKRLIELDDTNHVHYFNYAQLLILEDRKAEATELLRKALLINPDYKRAQQVLQGLL